MKKLSLLVAFAVMSLVSTTTFAQEIEESIAEEVIEQEDKIEIEVGELPEAIMNAISTNFSELTAAKAFKTLKDDNEFYLVVLVKDDAQEEVLFDAEGNVIEQ